MSNVLFCVADVIPEQIVTHLTAEKPERPSSSKGQSTDSGKLHVELSCKLQQHKSHRYIFHCHDNKTIRKRLCGSRKAQSCCVPSLSWQFQRVSADVSRSRGACWGWRFAAHVQRPPGLEWPRRPTAGEQSNNR